MADHRKERGSVTLFGLGLFIVVLGLVGMSLDLWRAVAIDRELSAAVDAAAAAGATALDEDELRVGRVALDPDEARSRARDALVAHDVADRLVASTVDADTERVEVIAEAEVGTTLLRLLVGDELSVSATGTFEPRAG